MTAPAGFVNVFPGWNVWAVLQANDLSFNPLMIGVDPERRLRIWVEEHADAAPGVAVADPLNLANLKGGQVEPIQSAEGLEPEFDVAADKPGFVSLHFTPQFSRQFVRFWNRGAQAATPWPHDADFLLDTVYTPDPSNPITNAPQPGSLAGGANAALEQVGGVLKVVAIVAGVGLVVLVGVSLLNASRKAAA